MDPVAGSRRLGRSDRSRPPDRNILRMGRSLRRHTTPTIRLPTTGRLRIRVVGVVRALDCGESHENDAYVISEAIRASKDPRAKYVHSRGSYVVQLCVEGDTRLHVADLYGTGSAQDHFHISGDSRYDNETSLWSITQGGGPPMGNWAKPGDPVDRHGRRAECPRLAGPRGHDRLLTSTMTERSRSRLAVEVCGPGSST